VELIVTAPVAPEILIFVPATIEVTPVLDMVTAPVAPETLIPVPATLEVTPVLVIVIVSVAEATDVIPVPCAMVNVSPSLMVCDGPDEPAAVNELIVPGLVPELAAVSLP
jgi:hypothetical protein